MMTNRSRFFFAEQALAHAVGGPRGRFDADCVAGQCNAGPVVLTTPSR